MRRWARRAAALVAAAALAGCALWRPGVVAEAGGERIYERELEQEAALARARGEALDVPGTDSLARFYDRAVRELVDRRLLRQEAERRGFRVPDELVDAEVDNLRAQYGEQGFRRWLEDRRMTEEDLRRRVREEKIVGLLMTDLERSVEVTDAQVEAYYREHRREFAEPARARVRLLLFRSRDAAQAARDRIAGGQRSFQDYRSFGLGSGPDPSVYEARADGSDPVLEPLAFGTRPGGVHGPVKVGALWAVYRVEGVTPERPRPLAEVRAQVEDRVRAREVDRARRALLERLRRERGVRIYRTYASPSPQAQPGR